MKSTKLLFLLLICTGSALAQNVDISEEGDFSTEDGWIPLQDDFSRAELLQMAAPEDLEPMAIPQPFRFPTSTLGKDAIFGIDISHNDKPKIPFDQMAADNVHYVYVKATQGTTFKDPMFAQYWSKLAALPAAEKVARGVYHFLSASDDPKLQAERFVAFMNLHGGVLQSDLSPVMDLEWDIGCKNCRDRWLSHSPQEIVSRALIWLNRVQELTGKTPMVYTARSWWLSAHIPEADFAKLSKFNIWIADYSAGHLATEAPAVPNKEKASIWQFSESAKLTGYSGVVDANIFYGSEAEFETTFLSSK